MFADSTKVYHKMIALNPESPRLCEWQNKVVRNTLSAGTKRDQVQEINRLGIAYDRVKALPTAKKDLVEECRNAFHDISKELALVWHKEAQRTKNPDTYVLVKYVYKDYLDHFPKEKGALRHGLLLRRGAVDDRRTGRRRPSSTPRWSRWTPRASTSRKRPTPPCWPGRTPSTSTTQGQGPRQAGRQTTRTLKPQPIPEYQKKMIAAFDTYIKYVPDAPELVTIKYRKARIYYEYNHFDKAVRRCSRTSSSKHTEATSWPSYSANLLLDSPERAGQDPGGRRAGSTSSWRCRS